MARSPDRSVRSLLVAMPGAPSSFLLLVAICSSSYIYICMSFATIEGSSAPLFCALRIVPLKRAMQKAFALGEILLCPNSEASFAG